MSRFRFFAIASAAILLFAVVLPSTMPGCSLMDYGLRDTLDPESGSVALPGIEQDIRIRRDELGIPLIEAQNRPDLVFAAGWVMASDRLAQMVTYSLLGQGRMSEMVGRLGLDIDVYIRTLGLPAMAQKQYRFLSDDIKSALSDFSRGVNAYLETHRDRLPLDFKLSGYSPEPWEPIDSLYVFNVLNLGLSFNLREEIVFLNLAKHLGAEKAAWLFPVYPDEPLPFEKAAVLSELDLGSVPEDIGKMAQLDGKLSRMFMPLGVAASNNWAVAPERAARGATIVANDTHLPLEHPPIWMLLQFKTPEIRAAGISMPGIPGIVAGYNGHIAWGMTMVMGDSQDVFIERLKEIDGTTCYQNGDSWVPVQSRTEVFRIQGEAPVERTVSATRHGPLLNAALASEPMHPALPPGVESRYGIAVQIACLEADYSFDGMYALMFATDMETAHAAVQKVRFMDLNLVYGNADEIAWQVTGCYPQRRKGRGQLPSPGWTGEYDWEGYLPVDAQPYVKNPPEGYFCTANHRTVPPENPPMLGTSWYAPERIERIEQVLSQNSAFTWQDAVALQNDRFDLLVPKVRQLLFDSPMAEKVRAAIETLPDRNRCRQAGVALEVLSGFDGDMQPDAPGAALFSIFQHQFIRNLFLDELGPENGTVWDNYLVLNTGIYAADQDHLLGREESPFWNNVYTERIETKADILAESLADAVNFAEKKLGSDPSDWKWGELHTYEWKTGMSKMRPFLPPAKSFAAWLIGRYTDRGPYPAGGSLNSPNVAGFRKGKEYDTWLVPAMRLVVDFSLEEPVFLTICGGQSGNPASPHYDDGIAVWLSGQNRQMAWTEAAVEKQYDHVFVLKAERRAEGP